MDSGETSKALIQRILASLEQAEVPYMVTGSLASSLYGEPRSTHDIDVVIDPTRDSLEKLLDEFPAEAYYVSRDAAFETLETRSLFNVIDFASGWKVDFIIRKDREFSVTEFGRRRIREVLGFQLYVASAEDVILAKLEWARMSDSERQIRDVAGILRAQGDALETEYVETWASHLDVLDELEMARLAANR